MWIRTKAGKNMPVNPQMINYRRPEAGKKAEEKLVTPQGEIVAADRTDGRDAEGFGYISHFLNVSAFLLNRSSDLIELRNLQIKAQVKNKSRPLRDDSNPKKIIPRICEKVKEATLWKRITRYPCTF